jgi:hypothetical protein
MAKPVLSLKCECSRFISREQRCVVGVVHAWQS